MTPADRTLLHGTVDLLVLRTLLAGPMHGFGVSRLLRDRSEGVVVLGDGALYQALHRMERRGWVSAEWGLSDKGKRAKFYALTPEGRKRLEAEREAWREYTEAVDRVLAPEEG